MTPMEELQTVLDEEHAQGLVEYRKGIKKPLTAFAAKLLARELAKTPDPNKSAEEMILRSWQGFKASWVKQDAAPAPEMVEQMRDRVAVNQLDSLFPYLPSKFTDRSGNAYFTPQEIEAAKARRVN